MKLAELGRLHFSMQIDLPFQIQWNLTANYESYDN